MLRTGLDRAQRISHWPQSGMRRLRDLPFGHQLTVVIMATAAASLLLACAVFAVWNAYAFRRSMARDLNVLAEIIRTNCTAALAFDDRAAAHDVLAALAARQHVVHACLLKDGKPFAVYLRAGAAVGTWIAPAKEARTAIARGHVTVMRPLAFGDKDAGSLHIESDALEVHEQMHRFAIFTFVVLLASTFLAYALASRLKLLIARPILELAQVAKQVTTEKNYALRATEFGSDEVGQLIHSFNAMLDEIHRRDSSLLRHGDRLEEQVAVRTAELRAMNTQLRLAMEKAEAGSRAKSVFLSNVSHELRTPLTVIHSFTEIMLDQDDLSAQERREFHTTIIEQTERLTRLISDVLDFAKIEAGEFPCQIAPARIEPVVESCLSALYPLAAARGLQLRNDLTAPQPLVLADPDRLSQVFTNLVQNAIKFTPPGGLIRIEAQRSASRTLTVRTPAGAGDGEHAAGKQAAAADAAARGTFHGMASRRPAANGYVVLSVHDTGIGIDAADQPRVFERFGQLGDILTDKPSGTGLGLTIAGEIMVAHGGALWVESERGAGATFSFSLPLAAAAITESDTTSASADAPPAMGRQKEMEISCGGA